MLHFVRRRHQRAERERTLVLQTIRDGNTHVVGILAATRIPAARLPQIIASLEQDGAITREPRDRPPTYSVT